MLGGKAGCMAACRAADSGGLHQLATCLLSSSQLL